MLEIWFEIKNPENEITIDLSKEKYGYPEAPQSYRGVYEYPIVAGRYSWQKTITRPELISRYKKKTKTGQYIEHGKIYTNGNIDVRIKGWTHFNEGTANEALSPEMEILKGKDNRYRELSFRYGSGSDAGTKGRSFSVHDEDRFFEEFHEGEEAIEWRKNYD